MMEKLSTIYLRVVAARRHNNRTLGLESTSSNDASDPNNNSSGEELEMEVATDEFLFDQTTYYITNMYLQH